MAGNYLVDCFHRAYLVCYNFFFYISVDISFDFEMTRKKDQK